MDLDLMILSVHFSVPFYKPVARIKMENILRLCNNGEFSSPVSSKTGENVILMNS